MATSLLIPLLISITALIILFAIYFILFLQVYRNKQRQNLLEKQRLKHEYESQLLNSRLEIQEETLSRVSMEIHDNICQNLGAIKHQLSGTIQNNDINIEQLRGVSTDLSENISLLRNISHTLNSNHVSTIGLLDAIEKELDFQRSIHKVTFNFDVRGEEDILSDETELILFRILQEAISNSIKHGNATQIDIAMYYLTGTFRMSIKDNGKGFESNEKFSGGIGLLNMRQRIKLINGNIEIISAPGEGTEIKISITHNNKL
jgi:two-component system NarL family sensor kinase